MQLTLTGPIEAFIQRQVAQGYKDADEVARQAFLRWMNEESDTPQTFKHAWMMPPRGASSQATGPAFDASSPQPDVYRR